MDMKQEFSDTSLIEAKHDPLSLSDLEIRKIEAYDHLTREDSWKCKIKDEIPDIEVDVTKVEVKQEYSQTNLIEVKPEILSVFDIEIQKDEEWECNKNEIEVNEIDLLKEEVEIQKEYSEKEYIETDLTTENLDYGEDCVKKCSKKMKCKRTIDQKVNSGFIKADSENLPEVDMFMVFDYFNKKRDFISTEIQGIKLLRSDRQNYGDNAIGYVQLKQQGALCELIAKITPIKSKNYNVSFVINTEEKEIVSTKCQDCAASEGGCNHQLAFLMWLHRRSEEASPTEKICYWKKSKLSSAPTTKRFISTIDFGKKNTAAYDDSILQEYISIAKKQKVENTLMRYYNTDKYSDLSIHNLGISFNNTSEEKNPKKFIEFCKTKMKSELILEVEADTRKQSDSTIWHEMRYGRITASKAHSVTRCKGLDDCLVESILGEKLIQTTRLKLKRNILKLLEKQTGQKFFKAGIFLSQQNPLISASPDAINKEFVVEIKNPTTEKSCLNYVDSDGNIKEKCLYKIQIQMYLSKRMRGIFVMSHPEDSEKITIKYCNFDEKLVKSIIKQLNEFWLENIFNKI